MFLTTALFSESKIILAAFSTEENTHKALELYKTSLSYQKLLALQKEDSFKVFTRASGKYFVVVAEKFQKEDIAQKAHLIIKTIFPHSYLQNIRLKKQVKITKKRYDYQMIKDTIYIFITLIVFFIIFYYIRKLKYIYDQY